MELTDEQAKAGWERAVREAAGPVVERVMLQGDPGKRQVHDAAMRLAKATGARETREACLALAAECLAWAIVIPDEGRGQAWRERAA